MRGQADTYTKEIIFTYPDMKVRVLRPDLAEDERSRRVEQIKQAAIKVLKGVKKC